MSPFPQAAYRVTQFCKARGHGARGATTWDRQADNSRHGGNRDGLYAKASCEMAEMEMAVVVAMEMYFLSCAVRQLQRVKCEREGKIVRGGGKFVRLLLFLAQGGSGN
jgi:hypothetical protein